jgi:hypothetical protein
MVFNPEPNIELPFALGPKCRLAIFGPNPTFNDKSVAL